MVNGYLKVSLLFKTDALPRCWLPIMPIWLSRTIPMSKYFSGSQPLRHNEVQLYIIFQLKSSSVGRYFHFCVCRQAEVTVQQKEEEVEQLREVINKLINEAGARTRQEVQTQ